MIAADTDVEIPSTRIIIPPTFPQPNLALNPVDMLFRLDSISQEMDETFTLTLNTTGLTGVGAPLGVNPIIRQTMTGTVVDVNRKCHCHQNVFEWCS